VSTTSGRRRRRLPDYEGELQYEAPTAMPTGGTVQLPKRSPITGESLADDPNVARRRRKKHGRTAAEAAAALLNANANGGY